MTFTRFSLRCGGLWNSDGICKLSLSPPPLPLSLPLDSPGIKPQTAGAWMELDCLWLPKVLPVSSMVHVTFSVLNDSISFFPHKHFQQVHPLDWQLSPPSQPTPRRQKNCNSETQERTLAASLASSLPLVSWHVSSLSSS